MPSINVETRDGRQIMLDGDAGRTVMSVLREAGLVEAICGGQCACATCHVHVSPGDVERIGRAGGVEQELLETSLEADSTSRLSCQITLTDELDGMRLRVAAEEA